MITLSVGGLPRTMTEESLTELFSEFGTVSSLKLIKDLISGECKGLAIIGMESHEACAAIAGLRGKIPKGSPHPMRVELVSSSEKCKGGTRR